MCPGTNQSWKLITDFSWRATRSSLGNSEGIVERRVRRFPWRRKEGCYNNAGRSQTLLKSMYLKTIPWHPHLHTPSLEVATACGWAAFSLAGFFAFRSDGGDRICHSPVGSFTSCFLRLRAQLYWWESHSSPLPCLPEASPKYTACKKGGDTAELPCPSKLKAAISNGKD